MTILRTRAHYRAVAHGVFHCERCGGDRPYRRRAGRTYLHVLGVPVLSVGPAREHLRCGICGTCYRLELLAVPTIEQMQRALLRAAAAAAAAMLRAGGQLSPAARRRAVLAVRAAGFPGYDDASLDGELAGPRPAGGGDDPGPALRSLAIQLEERAREWFLAEIVRIGLADGPLTAAERQAARRIAGELGMSQALARDVIWLTEEAAATG